MKPIHRTFGLFLFAALLLLKVSALHALTHNDNTDEISDCVVCHISAEEQQDFAFLPLELNVEFKTFYSYEESTIFAHQSLNGKTYTKFQYSRPPPSKTFLF